MKRLVALVTLAPLVACEPQPPPPPPEPKLTLAQQVKIVASECHDLAVEKTGGFDPRKAEEPPRTISQTERRGGEVAGSGAIARGAARGALVGGAAGAIDDEAGLGAGIGAAVGGLFGGIRRRREVNAPVTRTYANPAYEEYVAARMQFKRTFQACMAERTGANEAAAGQPGAAPAGAPETGATQ